MKFGMLIGDVPRSVDPLEQLDGILRQNELDILDEADLMGNYYETVKDSVAVGTAQEVIDHFIRVARELPGDPIIIKPQWPQMHIDEVIDAIDTLGREVIPALAEVDPMPLADIEASLAPAAGEVAAELERLG